MKILAGLARSAQTKTSRPAASAECLRMLDSSKTLPAEHNTDIQAQHQVTEGSAEEVDTRTLIILAGSATAGVLLEFYDSASLDTPQRAPSHKYSSLTFRPRGLWCSPI